MERLRGNPKASSDLFEACVRADPTMDWPAVKATEQLAELSDRLA